jgi:hypothetical protein
MGRAFRPDIVEDPQTPGNLSLYGGVSRLASARPVYRVYDGCVHVFSTTHRSRALAQVRALAEGFLPRGPMASQVIEMALLGVVGPHGAMLIPDQMRHAIPELELRLERAGIRLVEGRSVIVDTSRRELVLPRPRLGPSDDSPHTRLIEGIEPGVKPLVAWLLVGGRIDSATAARAVVEGMTATYRRAGAATNLQIIAELAGGLPVLWSGSYRQAIATITQTLGGHP